MAAACGAGVVRIAHSKPPVLVQFSVESLDQRIAEGIFSKHADVERIGTAVKSIRRPFDELRDVVNDSRLQGVFRGGLSAHQRGGQRRRQEIDEVPGHSLFKKNSRPTNTERPRSTGMVSLELSPQAGSHTFWFSRLVAWITKATPFLPDSPR